MVGAKRGRPRLLDSHQRSYIWGRHLVLETLEAGRWPVNELYLAEEMAPADVKIATDLAKTCRPVLAPRSRLTQLVRAEDHQGYVAQVGPYPYADRATLIATTAINSLWLALDGVQDPFNLGAMLRSAEVFGVAGVFIGTRGQAGINSLAARASAGAVNRLSVVREMDLTESIAALRGRGARIVGTDLTADHAIDAADLSGPLLLVIGGEGAGLSTVTARQCDELVKIPQMGGLNSLNAAAAAAVCLYEANRQRRAKRAATAKS